MPFNLFQRKKDTGGKPAFIHSHQAGIQKWKLGIILALKLKTHKVNTGKGWGREADGSEWLVVGRWY